MGTSAARGVYNKLFSKILDSSVWLAPDATRLVWITLLAAMDEEGFCQFATVANLAHRARVSLEAGAQAVKELESPEPDSATAEDDGRRIERVPHGWIVLNAGKYRELVTRVESLEANRRRVARHRAKGKVTVTSGNGSVMTGNAMAEKRNASVMQSEAYALSETEEEEEEEFSPSSMAALDLEAWKRWVEYRKEIKRPLRPVSMKAAARALAAYGDAQAAVVERSIAQGWQGLFPLTDKPSGKAAVRPRLRTADEIEADERARGSHGRD